MLGKIWRWLVKLVQSWFGGKRPKPHRGQRQNRRDAECQALFMELLEMARYETSESRLYNFFSFDERKISEAELTDWLRRFGEKLLDSGKLDPGDLTEFGDLARWERARELAELARNLGWQMRKREIFTSPEPALANPAGETIKTEIGDSQDSSATKLDREQPVPTCEVGDPEDLKSFDPEAVDCYNRGEEQLDADNFEQALALFERAIETEPSYHQAWNNKGNVLSGLERYYEAIACYDRAIEIEPSYHQAWANKGNVLSGLERYYEAIACYDRTIEIEPSYHQAWDNKGFAINDLGRYLEAIKHYDRAIEIEPSYHQAWVDKGYTLSNLGRYSEAIKHCDRAIQIKSNSCYAWTNKGITLSRLGCYEEAINCYDRALQADNESCRAWNNRALTVLILQGYRAALDNYDLGLETIKSRGTPDGCGGLHRGKGNMLYQRGQGQMNCYRYWDKAKDCYLQALRFFEVRDLRVQYLETLQDLVEVCRSLGQLYESSKAEAEDAINEGIVVLDKLLDDTGHNQDKIRFARKFSSFYDLRVDALIDKNPEKALEDAEEQKNLCLRWMQSSRYEKERVPTANYAAMQSLLDSDSAIIYWHLSPVALTAFILRHNLPLEAVRVRGFEKFQDWIGDWKRNYRDYCQGRDREATPEQDRQDKDKQDKDKQEYPWFGQMEAKLAELKEILEIEETISPRLWEIRELTIVPHRDLHLLPLEYLFLDLGIAINRLPSAQVGIDLPPPNREKLTASASASLIMVENPERIKYAKIESAAISQIYSSRPLAEEEASKEAVLEQLGGGADIFHFTGHGSHDFADPRASELTLANGEKLTLGDLCDRGFSSYTLAVLSACETAMVSPDGWIDEFVGFASAFLAQQTNWVVSSLWRVDEASTAMLLVKFYDRLQAGVAPPLALQQARDWLRGATNKDIADWCDLLAAKLGDKDEEAICNYLKRKAKTLRDSNLYKINDKPYEHPYYWAAFVITGRGK